MACHHPELYIYVVLTCSTVMFKDSSAGTISWKRGDAASYEDVEQ